MINHEALIEKLSNKTILLTGASGTVGRNIISLINKYNIENSAHITIFACVRNEKKIIPFIMDKDFIRLYPGDILDKYYWSTIDTSVDYIIHCAANTNSKFMITNPVETLDGIVIGTKNVLEFALRCNIMGILYVSSMEIYGDLPFLDRKVSENDIGKIDILAERSSYPLGKRLAENYCYCYYKEFGLPIKIVRLAQTFGKGITEEDNRVYVQFAKSAISGCDIILHTGGESMGNYVDSEEAVQAMLLVLLMGKTGEAYNVVNEDNSMSIKEMAEMVANKIASSRIEVRYDISDNHGYSKIKGARLSARKVEELGWKATISLEEMYRKTIEEIGEL
ncbi:NAD-dependent epimerase/dehydratase family protein [Lacrimispora xylanolytica]|uniref:NAD(P)-dependent oxidoreductase n=1 Tax=Lacrimispora xylanolytica TaxID=29375 RepID=A0ABY7AC72_9FIRM|nr:NAD(P)-dependent oxidoreductase [Lacrimispora xylanolytica]WAJ24092.1 NAD(P)-dependent oxidoreductase [Lacrimispora xylanolytica]